MFAQIPRAGEPGEYDYEPADPGLTFQPAPTMDGRFVAVRDQSELARQRHEVAPTGNTLSERWAGQIIASPTTHAGHFGKEWDGEKYTVEDPRQAKQHLRSLKALERQMNMVQIVSERQEFSGSTGIRREVITDEQFFELHAMYKAAAARGEAHLVDFTPFAVYSSKLINKKTGKPIRPLFKGEVGLRPNGTIVFLESGYGTGNLIAVPGQMELKPGETIIGVDRATPSKDETVVVEAIKEDDGPTVVGKVYSLPRFGGDDAEDDGEEVEELEDSDVLPDPFPPTRAPKRIIHAPKTSPILLPPGSSGLASSGEDDVEDFKPNPGGVENYVPHGGGSGASEEDMTVANNAPEEYGGGGGPRKWVGSSGRTFGIFNETGPRDNRAPPPPGGRGGGEPTREPRRRLWVS